MINKPWQLWLQKRGETMTTVGTFRPNDIEDLVRMLKVLEDEGGLFGDKEIITPVASAVYERLIKTADLPFVISDPNPANVLQAIDAAEKLAKLARSVYATSARKSNGRPKKK